MRYLSVLAPWFVLLLGVALVWESYPGYPLVWPSHFDIHNHADGWTQKSLGGVLLPIGLAAAVCLFLELLAQAARFMNSKTMSPEWSLRATHMNQEILRGISLALASFFSYVAWRIPMGQGMTVAPMVVFVLICVLGPIARFAHFAAQLKSAGQMPPGYGRFVYNNPADPRVWVPKLSGMGTTLNFAHPVSWAWMALLLGGPLVMVAFNIWH